MKRRDSTEMGQYIDGQFVSSRSSKVIQWEKKTSTGAGKLEINMEKENQPQFLLHTKYKIDSKWIIDITGNAKIMNLLEESMWQHLYKFEIGKYFVERT